MPHGTNRPDVQVRYNQPPPIIAIVIVIVITTTTTAAAAASPFGAANDPLFWPIHVIHEKNWAYMRMAKGLNSSWSDSTVMRDTHLTGWAFDEPLAPFTGFGQGPGGVPFPRVEPPKAHRYYTNAEVRFHA